jgi:hypothetical protein
MDACDTGIGAVLMQDGHPLAFLSKSLSVQHRTLSIYGKEFLVLIMAVERWRPYLEHSEFLIKTDHHSLTYLEEQTLHTPMQKKAMARLMGLQFCIIYKKGTENSATDALSRVGQVFQLQALSKIRPVLVQEVLNLYVTDKAAQAKLQSLAVHSPDEQGFALDQSLIKVHGKIWVGANSALQTKLINVFHNSAVGGHLGVLPTYKHLKRLFSWVGMKVSVEDLCANARHASRLSTATTNQPDFCNPCPFHRASGVN